jgi:hypothetical protein
MKMKSRSFVILVAMLLFGTLTFQACFYSRPGYYGPPRGPVVVGDYDEYHVWHDRSWWISNRHEWVHQHHPEWVQHETPAEHRAYEHQH